MEQPIPIPIQAPRPRVEFPVWGVILVLTGALFLAAQGGHVHLGTFLLRWWPLVLIAVGGFALFFTLGALKWKLLLKVWPIVLVAVGASMLLGARRKH